MAAIHASSKVDKRTKQLKRAQATAQDISNTLPQAVHAYFDAAAEKIVIEFSNLTEFRFPPHLAQGLESATLEELAEVEITPSRLGLRWEALDADVLIPELMLGIYGTKQWMAAMGAKGGKSKSPAKGAAARSNGAKGGRPRKHRLDL